ncbi:hypothetical protein ACFY0N_00300 [Streptomyces vinaceus]|uniref:hypothetical protein n=1 Tax=Streptomyces vinaceus TaxID=1960 RepID=UPI003694BF28
MKRSARSIRRRPGEAPEEVPEEVPPPPRAEKRLAPVLSGGPAAAVAVTDSLGIALWRFPTPFEATPVISAVPVAVRYGPGEATTVAIEDVSLEWVSVQVSLIGGGTFRSAGPGVQVHLTAVPGRSVPLG